MRLPSDVLVVTGTGTGVGKTVVTAALAGGPLAGAVPAGAGRLTRPEFRALAARALAPHLGGRFDPAGFGDRHTHPKEPT